MLHPHDVYTAFRMGWSELSNGRLLTAAATADFDAMITVDQGVRYQQNLKQVPLSVLILATKKNTPQRLRPHAAHVLRILPMLASRSVVLIDANGNVQIVSQPSP